MEQIDSILDNRENINKDFVIHIKSQDELYNLIRILGKYGFQLELNLFQERLSEWMCRVAAENRYNTCFRIKNRENDRCVAWNPSIEHWRLYYKDIIELENGEMIFHEGEYTRETAEIEADKIISEIAEGGPLKNMYSDKTKEQIIDFLMHRR